MLWPRALTGRWGRRLISEYRPDLCPLEHVGPRPTPAAAPDQECRWAPVRGWPRRASVVLRPGAAGKPKKWHSRGHGFDPRQLHQIQQQLGETLVVGAAARCLRCVYFGRLEAAATRDTAPPRRRRCVGTLTDPKSPQVLGVEPEAEDVRGRSDALPRRSAARSRPLTASARGPPLGPRAGVSVGARRPARTRPRRS